MNLELTCERYQGNIIDSKIRLGGKQYLFRFGNGYGASVVKHIGSYGHEDDLWELAVLRFAGENADDYMLDYTTHITDDVLGNLSDDEVCEALALIEVLPEHNDPTSVCVEGEGAAE